MRSLTLFTTAAAAVVSAQTASQNAAAAALAAQIPACVLPCDDAAILSVGCGLTDYACHCARGSQLQTLIPACLEKNSTCSSSDLALFATIPPKICAALNSTTLAGTGTAVSAGLPTGGATAGVNGTASSTATTASGTSTAPLITSGAGSATAVPHGPSTASSTPTPSYTNDATPAGLSLGLFAVVAVGIIALVL